MDQASIRNIEAARNKRLKRLYGITTTEYEKFLEAQCGVCAGCKRPPKLGGRRLHVDHNHSTHKVRGLLCFHCNYALRWLRDDSQIAYNLYLYLKQAGD